MPIRSNLPPISRKSGRRAPAGRDDAPLHRGLCRGGPRCDARMGKIRPPQFYGGVWRRSGPRTSTSVSRTSTYRDRYQEAFRELIEVKMEGLPIEPRYCPHQYPDGRRKEERTTVGTRRRKKA